MEIEEKVARKISPTDTQREQVGRVTEFLIKKVRNQVASYELDLKVRLVGSVAKDTYIFRPDIDIFVMFPTSVSRKDLERIGLGIAKKVLRGEERYAEHPYMHGIYRGYEVDIVPCYSIQDPNSLKSAVDRTPFHTDYVNKNLKASQKDQVRLLKQFMKGIGTYGAEAKVQGFSGYLVELLILKYGDFGSTILAAARWRKGVTLSIENGGSDKFTTPLVFYDPVDQTRNVSSALSIDSFSRFVFACQEYLREPRESFFFPKGQKTWTKHEIRNELVRRGTRLLALRLDLPDITNDDLYPQLRKTLAGVCALLEDNDFKVLDSNYHVGKNKVTLLFELQSDRLPALKKHYGPPIWMEHSARFLEKWNGQAMGPPFIENGRWVANIVRPYENATALLKAEVANSALGSDIKSLEGLDILEHDQILSKNLKGEVCSLLDKTFPWKR